MSREIMPRVAIDGDDYKHKDADFRATTIKEDEPQNVLLDTGYPGVKMCESEIDPVTVVRTGTLGDGEDPLFEGLPYSDNPDDIDREVADFLKNNPQYKNNKKHR